MTNEQIITKIQALVTMTREELKEVKEYHAKEMVTFLLHAACARLAEGHREQIKEGLFELKEGALYKSSYKNLIDECCKCFL